MRFVVLQENINKALSVVSKTASNRSGLDVLNNILIRAKDNEIEFVATNLEVAITHNIPGKIIDTGEVLLPAKTLTELVGSLPQGTIEIGVLENKATVSAKGFESSINTIGAAEFPVIPTLADADPVEVSPEGLRKCIKKVINNTAKDDTRPILNGVFLSITKEAILAAATDSYRLAEQSVLSKTEAIATVVVPQQSAQEMIKALEQTEKAEIKIGSAQIELITDKIIIVSKTIQGNYPDYNKLIPKNTDALAELNKTELLNAIKAASVFARDSGGAVIVETGSDKTTISSVTNQIGENKSEIESKTDGEGRVSLNSRYLIDALNNIESESITIKYSSNISPFLILPEDESTKLTQLVMPLKT